MAETTDAEKKKPPAARGIETKVASQVKSPVLQQKFKTRGKETAPKKKSTSCILGPIQKGPLPSK